MLKHNDYQLPYSSQLSLCPSPGPTWALQSMRRMSSVFRLTLIWTHSPTDAYSEHGSIHVEKQPLIVWSISGPLVLIELSVGPCADTIISISAPQTPGPQYREGGIIVDCFTPPGSHCDSTCRAW